jgi:hypothetical protein
VSGGSGLFNQNPVSDYGRSTPIGGPETDHVQ